jgi:sarcosine oxidase
MSHSFDVIVVGLGAMGSAAAYQLAKRGATILGIDAHHPPHTLGSSHGESRITRRAVGEGAAYLPLVQRTDAIWREIEAVTGKTLRIETGGLIIAPQNGGADWHGQGDFVTYTAQLATNYGVDHQLWSAAKVRDHAPALRVSDTDHAYYEPGGGVLLPERCVRVQLEQAVALGAKLQMGECVKSVKPNAGSVTVITDKATYHADQVILTAGPWIGDFLPPSESESLRVYRQVMYWFEADDPSEFDADRFPWVIWIGETQADFFAVFPSASGGTQGVKLMTEVFAETTTVDEIDRNVSEAEIAAMYETFVSRKLIGVGPQCLKASTCAYTVTPDEHFIIDHHPNSDRVWVASACSGHGFKHSAAVGEALAQLALGEPTTVDVSSFGWGRLATL